MAPNNPYSESAVPVITPILTQEVTNPVTYWDFLTTFFDYLSDSDRAMIENYWDGLKLSADELDRKATRLLSSSAPELSETNPVENYYEVVVSPFTSIPLNL